MHRVKIGAKDNGKPVPLSSNTDLILNVVVLKKNQYPPEMAPHYVQIATPHSKFCFEVTTGISVNEALLLLRVEQLLSF